MRNTRRHILAVTALLLAIAVLATSPTSAGPNEDLGILPVDETLYGKTYGDWGAAWWQWIIGIPPEVNPILDETGEFGAVDQAGQVWFLVGNFGGETERTLAVPAKTALFFPILNGFWSCPPPEEVAFLEFVAVEILGLDPDDVAALTDVELMRLVIGAQMDSAVSMSCTIDGVAVKNLKGYRAQTPVFTFNSLEFFGVNGACRPVVADGYWLLVLPLAAGEHTIRFRGNIENAPLGSFKLDVTYNLTVSK